jgi:hypothetical protein
VNTSANNDFPQRQNPASGVHIQPGHSNIVLLTISTEKREPWLANETAHVFLRQTWSKASAWRDGEGYSEKWAYVQENPFRKGLVQRIEDWPFKGRIFDLVWSGS